MDNTLRTYIEENTLRCEASRRGGGIEITVTPYLASLLEDEAVIELLHEHDDLRLTAYQNYLGGGMLGSIASDENFTMVLDKEAQEKIITPYGEELQKLAEALQRYYYELTNDMAGDYDEWGASESFAEQQRRPRSAY